MDPRANLKMFQPGNPGGPGRPKGSKHRISEAFLRAIADDFEAHGIEAIEQCRRDDPATYVRVVASLIPKEVLLGEDAENPLKFKYARIERIIVNLNDPNYARICAPAEAVEIQGTVRGAGIGEVALPGGSGD